MAGTFHNSQRRLFTYCATTRYEGGRIVAEAKPGQLLQSLLLFDHVIIRTIKLRELPGLVAAFGLQPTLELLRSGILTLSPDFASFAVYSIPDHHTTRRVSITRINSNRRLNLQKDIGVLKELLYFIPSPVQTDNLIEAAIAAFPEEPAPYGGESQEQARRDGLGSSYVLKRVVAARLRAVHSLAITANDFALVVHDEGTHVRFDTNLEDLARLSGEEVYSAISLSLAAMAELAVRIEEMAMFDSVSGFLPDELELFQAHTQVLLSRNNSQPALEQFQRVITLFDLPDVPPSGCLDVDAFLKLRESSDCAAFREWLSTAASATDDDITSSVGSFRANVAKHLTSFPGRVARYLVSNGIGTLHGIGPLASWAFSGIDSFLVDRVLSRPGAIAFISDSYPSLFGRG